MTRSANSSGKEKLMGSQVPSVRVAPEYEETDGQDAVKILRLGKLKPDEWQANALNDWMGRDGEIWTSPTCGMSVPRQNGKTCNIAGRIAAGMILYGEWHIYTAHLQKTATETFMELRGIFESPKLFKYVKEIKNALGREQIILKNGARVQFVARTRNGGRGLHGDCLTFDEAQELTDEQLASFLPCLAASKNPQTIYIGTPPDPTCTGTVFKRIRSEVLDGKTDTTSWMEFSVEEIGDVTDRKRWAMTNPALGRRMRASTIQAECEQMSPDTFARERLGWWTKEQKEIVDYAIDHDKWSACKSDNPQVEGKTAFGVKFSADGMWVSLAGAVVPKEGPALIELIARRPTAEGYRWLSDFLNERYAKASCVVIDGKNGVDLVVDRISDVWKYKGSVIRPNARDMISACTLITDGLNEGKLMWYSMQDDLNDSAMTSVKRAISGGWGFGGDNSSPIEACSLALWGAKTCKRDPSRKQRIG